MILRYEYFYKKLGADIWREIQSYLENAKDNKKRMLIELKERHLFRNHCNLFISKGYGLFSPWIMGYLQFYPYLKKH